MPEIKVSDLPNYETPDSNDYVLVLERSNSLPTTFKTYKTFFKHLPWRGVSNYYALTHLEIWE